MSRNPFLDPTLQEILQVIKPTRADWDTRIGVIDQLRSVVQSVECLRGATVQPFGSFVSNLFTRWGDLDISVDLFSGSSILFTGKKQKQTLLGHLLRALRANGLWYKLQFVIHARVPILKIVSGHQRISCDISIDNLEGLLKSRFLFWISEIDGRFRDLVLLVKEWAKAHNINDSKSGTFNSYSLSLLVIFHLQTCVPAILPPLRDIYPKSAVDDLKGVRKTAEESIAQVTAANIARFKSGTGKSANRSSLSELLVSFFAKFSDINLKAQELGVCPFTGRWENISTNTTWLPKTYSLFVEDPFEQPQNAARSVSRRNLDKIAQVFQITSRSLASDCNSNSIIAVLTGQHIQQLLYRTISLHSQYHANGTHNVRNLHGQTRPWNQQMQQNWSQNYNTPNPPYWPPQQSWPQNNPRNLQRQPSLQGQAWPVITQTQTQQKSQNKNGNRPFKNTSAGSSQNQGHIGKPSGHMSGVNSARPATIIPSQRGQMWRPRYEH
ncbi:PREDICTED: protein HESO1-like [Camelina sativa]|uniref:Protein HESO1-like n=1 Tax=Camelina sativa TaxID=90675 RepID=A0ABM0ZLA5_CAMSA|nr:PREDICTED: protein HESO1-like [Camelina sativa]XP_010517335.1 PREDICTED: protein HESO1-like [Camelina sativa]